MTKKMLIDATHAEETRVAVVESHGGSNRMEEFDYESKFRKPLKGSIFLAKVTRVEPSLQAAFVNFGGNRHGFLPFSEIHPDYFRIPVADREALIAEQEAELAAHDDEEEELEKAADIVEDTDADSDADDDHDDEDVIEEVGGNIDGDKPKKAAAKKKAPAKKPAAKKTTKKKDIEPEDLVPEDADAAEEASEDAATEEKPKKAAVKKKPAKKVTKAANVTKDSSNEIVDDSNEPNGNVKPKEEAPDEVVDSQNDGNKDPSESDGEKDDNSRGNRGGRGRGRGGRGSRNRGGRNRGGRGGRNASHDSRKVEVLGGTEYDDEGGNDRFRYNLRRKYKIQEVIKRGQIMLVQASKEERGNKGAAVTSYLSLPGRYCVLMPNSPRAGGVSRKIADYKDRNRMRDIIKSLEVPKGMSVIVRTAGVARTKAEIKRDLDYLLRLWNNIRELTLQSSAPALVYEEADLIKRSVRDLYTRDVEEIIVSGEEGFKNAKNFMKMLIPSHAKKVVQYKDADMPLFNRYKVEDQITEIGEPNARLKSGGYLVINPTEALVSIDVNSGRATKERHIEGTALNTNLEAADEVARQLRLRDLGGLVVIDFIDMEDRRNNGKVERRLKEALSGDRARIQIGRISSFGLLEMSRQRMNPSLTEAQYEPCKNCDGKGRVRSADATSVMLLRSLEEEGMKKRAAALIVHVSPSVAIYLLNNKREKLAEIEERYGFTVLIRVDDDATQDGYRIEVSKPSGNAQANDDSDGQGEQNNEGGKKRSRRGGRGRRGGRNRNRDENNQGENQQDNNQSDNSEAAGNADAETTPQSSEDDAPNKSSRGRGRGRSKAKTTEESAPVEAVADTPAVVETAEEKPKKPPAKRAKKAEEPAPVTDAPKEEAPKKDDAPKDYEVVNEPPKKKKKGWWSRG